MPRQDRGLALAALAVAVLAASASAAPAPEAAPEPVKVPDRVRLVFDAAFWPTGPTYGDTQTFTEYAEKTAISASYEAGSGLGPAVAVQVSLYRGLGLLIGYSRCSRDVVAKVNVSRPHPLHLNQHRSAAAENPGYELSEGAVHIDVAYARAAGRLEWSLFAGATLFQVEADLLSKPTYTDVYPYDELVIASTPSSSVNDSPTGYNVGGRLDYRFGSSRRLGAGLQVMYSKAGVTLKGTPESTPATFDSGGLSLGAGVRVYF